MSLFAPPIKMELTDDELAKVTLPIAGDGGDQRLLDRILAKLRGHELELEDDELQKVLTYSQYNGGSGGYQARFRAVLSAAFRAGWVQP